ncbi:MAG: porin family protein [Candidatus Syntrophosphaera sp.]|nr:porin family protein [Candidatus Syntrophosphaera sp.]
MKRTIILIVMMAALAVAFAQSPISTGQTQLNAGVGLSAWGVPVYAGLDYGLSRDVSIGAEVSFRSYRQKIAQVYWDHSVLGISGNVNYHFNHILNIPEPWDFYAGLNLGYYVFNSPSSYPGSYKSQLGIAGQIGGRYYFTDKLGVNLEFGGGNAFSGGKLGISLKL